MLVFVIIALLILILTLSLHFCQHFQCICKCCTGKTKSHHERTNAQLSVRNIEQQIQMNLLRRTNHTNIKCCYSIEPLEEFDFFPMSFLWYITFVIILCLLTIITEVLKYFIYSEATRFINVSFIEIRKMNTIHILDYIIIYGILILCLWASLFSFYRYLSTLNSATKLQSLSTKKLFKKFTIYAIIFCIIFIIQIHLYYWIFSVLIAMFCGFNFYCTNKFASILIKQFKQFNVNNNQFNLNSNFQQEMNDMLYSTLFTKYISLICCGLQSIELTLFLITYNIAIIHYLTILWSISGFIFSLTFIRNRMFLKRQITKFRKLFTYSAHTNPQIESESTHVQTSTDELIDINSTKVLSIQLVKEDGNTIKFNAPKSSTPQHIRPQNSKLNLMTYAYSNPCTPGSINEQYSIDDSVDGSPIVPQYKRTMSLNMYAKMPVVKPQLKLSNSNPIKISKEDLEIKDDNIMENYRRVHSTGNLSPFESNGRVSTNTVRALSVNTGYRNSNIEFSPLVLQLDGSTMIEKTSISTPIILEDKEHDCDDIMSFDTSNGMSDSLSPQMEEMLNTFGTLTRCGFLSPKNVNNFHFFAI